MENEFHVTDTDQSITDVETVLDVCTACIVQNKQVHAVGRMHSFILSKVTRISRLLLGFVRCLGPHSLNRDL